MLDSIPEASGAMGVEMNYLRTMPSLGDIRKGLSSKEEDIKKQIDAFESKLRELEVRALGRLRMKKKLMSNRTKSDCYEPH